MIAEWFYWLTGEIGYGINNAILMREHTCEEDVMAGIFVLWFMLSLLFVLCLLLFVAYIKNEKEKKENEDE